MCNAVRDHVGCLNFLVWISEQRQTQERHREFTSICVCLLPINKFGDEHKAFEKHPCPSLKIVFSYLIWKE